MDQALKQRLMGALVLVLLAMIILPIVFEGNRKYEVSRTSQLPPAPQYAPVNIADPVSPAPPPSGKPLDQMFDMSAPADSTSSSDAIAPVEAATVNLTAPQTNTVSQVSTKAAAPVAAVPKATPAISASKPATTPAANTAAQQRPKLAANGLPEGWIVQMGVFSDTSKANKINSELLKRKYPVFLRKIATPKSTGTKIAIGPFVDRKQADRVKSEVDALYHVNAIVVRFQP